MTTLRAGLASIRTFETIFWASSLAIGASAAQAQSLTEVVDAARTYDAAYLGARANADAAHWRYEQNLALHRPSASLQVQVARQVQNTPYIPDPSSSTTDTGGASVSAQQTLFNRQNDIQIDQAAKAEEISQAQLRQAEEDLLIRVSQAYFDVLASTDALQTVQANKAAIGEQLSFAKRNFEVGNATITDTREAEARSDLARSQEIGAQNDLQVAHVTLDQLVGRNGVTPHPLAQPNALPPVMPSAPQDWVRLAEADSPVLKQAQLNFDIAELETKRAKAASLPTITAGASYGKQYTHNASTYQGTFGVPTAYGGWGDNNSVNITLNLPLFAGFQIQNRERETVALEALARTNVEGARNTATLSTRQTFLGAQSLSAQVKALEAAEVSSKLALDATMLGYKVGVKVNLDVLNAQSQLYTTQRDLAKARYDYLLSTLRLRQAAGTLTFNDLVAVNALLAP